jgi:hypothetical protein
MGVLLLEMYITVPCVDECLSFRYTCLNAHFYFLVTDLINERTYLLWTALVMKLLPQWCYIYIYVIPFLTFSLGTSLNLLWWIIAVTLALARPTLELLVAL